MLPTFAAARCPHLPDGVDRAGTPRGLEQASAEYASGEAELAAFWRRREVKPHDYAALADKLLARVFGQRFLTPLEASDRVIRLDAQDARASTLVSNALRGIATPTISVASYVYTDVSDAPKEGDVQRIINAQLEFRN